jgi:hypothetical protein
MSDQDTEQTGGAVDSAPEVASTPDVLVDLNDTVISSEADMDEVLSKLDPADDGSDEGAVYEPDGTMESKENEQPGEPASQSEDLAKATSILERGKVPKHILDNLSTADAIEWAKDMGKVQGDADEAYRRNAELEKAVALQTEGAGEGSREEESPEGEQPTDRTDNPDPELKEFAEVYGEEAASEVSKFIDHKMARAESQNSAMESMLEGMMIRDAVSRLGDTFPQLRDADNLDKATTKALTLLGTGEYQGMDAIHDSIRDASRQEWAEDVATTNAAARNATNQARRNGTSGTSRQSSTQQNSTTPDDRENRVLAALESGASVEEARRAW